MVNYIAVIHKDEDSDYGVSFPDFLGCITVGATIDEAKDMAQEALQLHIDCMLEDNEELPSPSTLESAIEDDAVAYFIVTPVLPKKKEAVRINCTFDAGLLAAMDAKAEEKGMTRSGFIAEAVRKELHI